MSEWKKEKERIEVVLCVNQGSSFHFVNAILRNLILDNLIKKKIKTLIVRQAKLYLLLNPVFRKSVFRYLKSR